MAVRKASECIRYETANSIHTSASAMAPATGLGGSIEAPGSVSYQTTTGCAPAAATAWAVASITRRSLLVSPVRTTCSPRLTSMTSSTSLRAARASSKLRYSGRGSSLLYMSTGWFSLPCGWS